jgi:inorganic pyrophosphatase
VDAAASTTAFSRVGVEQYAWSVQHMTDDGEADAKVDRRVYETSYRDPGCRRHSRTGARIEHFFEHYKDPEPRGGTKTEGQSNAAQPKPEHRSGR